MLDTRHERGNVPSAPLIPSVCMVYLGRGPTQETRWFRLSFFDPRVMRMLSFDQTATIEINLSILIEKIPIRHGHLGTHILA